MAVKIAVEVDAVQCNVDSRRRKSSLPEFCAPSEPVRALTKIRENAKNSDWMLYFDTKLVLL